MSTEPLRASIPTGGLWTTPVSSKLGVTAASVIVEAMLSSLSTQPHTSQISLQTRLMLAESATELGQPGCRVPWQYTLLLGKGASLVPRFHGQARRMGQRMSFPMASGRRGGAKQDLGLPQHISLVGWEDGGTSLPQFSCTVNGDQVLRGAPIWLVRSFLWKKGSKKEKELGDLESKDSQGKRKAQTITRSKLLWPNITDAFPPTSIYNVTKQQGCPLFPTCCSPPPPQGKLEPQN